MRCERHWFEHWCELTAVRGCNATTRLATPPRLQCNTNELKRVSCACGSFQCTNSPWRPQHARIDQYPSRSTRSACCVAWLGRAVDTPSGGVVGARAHDESAQKHTTSNNLEQCGAWRRWARESVRSPHSRVPVVECKRRRAKPANNNRTWKGGGQSRVK